MNGTKYANEVEATKAHSFRFPWGKIVCWFSIGRYDIAQYHPYDFDANNAVILDEVAFHGWIDGRDAAVSYPTLEHAIVGLIAIKHDGVNTQAGEFFARMVQLPQAVRP